MSETAAMPRKFEFIAGNASLDFTNTVGGVRGGETTEYLAGGYPDLAAWAEQAGLLDPATALSLRRAAEQKPAVAGRVFARARAGLAG